MSDVDLMKCMDLAWQLGQILRMNPVWKKEYAIYGGNLNDAYIMCFNSNNGRWEIVTEAYGVLNLPQEATKLMAKMSELVKGKESSHD